MSLHTGEKRFQCEVCDKSFRQSKSYKEHLNCHNGLKPHKAYHYIILNIDKDMSNSNHFFSSIEQIIICNLFRMLYLFYSVPFVHSRPPTEKT